MLSRYATISFVLWALLFGSLLPLLMATEPSSVIAPAPDVVWHQGNKIEHLSSLRGKPVLILITDSSRNHAFRHQLSELQGHYERLAAHGLMCLVAFTQEEGAVPSNIPFVTLLDGAAVAKSYSISTPFGLALLGADGNLDCQSTRPLSGQRIDDLMDASYTTQEAMRRP
ncbi:MAG: hypothetical protein ACOYK6_01920 [Chthoniobacterales bacterium]